MKWTPLAFILETCLLLFSASQLHSNMIFENLFTFWQRFWYKNDKCEGSWSYFSANIWHPVLLSLTRKTRLCENLPHLKIWADINLPFFKNVIKCLWNQVVGEDQVKILPKSPIGERGHGTQVSDITSNLPWFFVVLGCKVVLLQSSKARPLFEIFRQGWSGSPTYFFLVGKPDWGGTLSWGGGVKYEWLQKTVLASVYPLTGW